MHFLGNNVVLLICIPVGDILRHRRLSLFGHVARLVPGGPAHDGGYESKKAMASWRRPPGRPRNIWLNKVQEDDNALPAIYAVEI